MPQGTREIPKTATFGEPVWEIAELFPEQGSWLEADYLSLKTNQPVEFNAGMIEVLPPLKKSDLLVRSFFLSALTDYIRGNSLDSTVLFGFPLHVPPAKYRQADVLYLTAEQERRCRERYAEEAELVVEVVIAGDEDRDYVTKREDYAAAGVPEYWIADRHACVIVVLALESGIYIERGHFTNGDRAISSQLPKFNVLVNDVFSTS